MVSDFSDTPVSSVESNGYRVATRVIFPSDADLDVMPLYIDLDEDESESHIHPEDVRGRDSIAVRPGVRMSLGSYFNAFPASYWRRWSVVRTVRLVVNTSGQGTVVVYKSNARGNRQRVQSVQVSGEHNQQVFDLPLETFGDGGFYWFDLVAGDNEMVLESAQWWVPTASQPHGTATFATTTLNKPDYVVKNLRAMAGDVSLRDVVDEILIIDQGTKKVAEYAGFDEVKAELGDQLVVIDQANLGGSGGFSRGMYEGATRGKSDYVILLDDDISLETESIIRLVIFADMCKKPTLVGGHMFDLFNRTVLHTYGEVVEPYYWQPALPHPDQSLGHDFVHGGGKPDDGWRPALHRMAAPAHRRRLQRLVDGPHPGERHQGDRPVVARLHQVGRRRVRPARQGGRLQHGFPARCRRLAHQLGGQGRPGGLAGLLPRSQPLYLGAAAQPVPARRRHRQQFAEARPEAPGVDAVLHGDGTPAGPA
ncbi:UDP-galactofuranosyl transferase GlfT2 [Propionibacterium freudenreichii]|nr:UDP-galactofuranosyl transferase GlfT2 [Propionibacterium freudenreichii]